MTKKIFYFLFSLFISLGLTTQAQNNMAKEFVEAHNKIRAEVGLPPLKWSNEIAAYAQDWANKLKNDNCAFKHRPNGKYGENLAMQWGGGMPSPKDFVAQWYGEKAAFDKHFLDGSGNVVGKCCDGFMEYGHYSQIVWENTTEVGCAVVKCGSKYICVCNYNPAGNMMGAKPFAKVKKSNANSNSSSNSNSNSNSNTVSDTELSKIGNKVCDCINQVMSKYDSRVIDYLKDVAKNGEEVAQQNLMSTLMGMSETEQEKLLTEFERLENMEDEMLNISVCREIEKIEAKFEGDEVFEEKMMNYLKNNSNCQIAYLFMMIGLQEEDDY